MIAKDIITDNYKLLHGDCLERMKEIPDGSVVYKSLQKSKEKLLTAYKLMLLSLT